MDADPERVHHSLLAQVQDYANCNLFPEQEARNTILHCMQARLLSIADLSQSVQVQFEDLSSSAQQCQGTSCRDR